MNAVMALQANNPRAIALIATAGLFRKKTAAEINGSEKIGRVFLAAFFVMVIVDIGAGMVLNQSLMSNQSSALTAIDYIIQFLSATTMVAAFTGAGICIGTALDRENSIGQRVITAVGGILLLAAVVMVAASIGWNHLSSLLSTLWTGTAEGVSLDASAGSAGPAQFTPLAVRLTAAVLFIGCGVVASLCEQAWSRNRRNINKLNVKFAEYEMITHKGDDLQNAAQDSGRHAEVTQKLQDVTYRREQARAALGKHLENRLMGLRRKLETPVPSVLSPVNQQQNHAKNRADVENWIQLTEKLASQNAGLLALVDKHVH